MEWSRGKDLIASLVGGIDQAGDLTDGKDILQRLDFGRFNDIDPGPFPV